MSKTVTMEITVKCLSCGAPLKIEDDEEDKESIACASCGTENNVQAAGDAEAEKQLNKYAEKQLEKLIEKFGF